MSRRKTWTAIFAGFVATGVMATPGAAQDTKELLDKLQDAFKAAAPGEQPKAPIEPNQFGSQVSTTVIPLSRFVPFIGGVYTYVPFLVPPGPLVSTAPYYVSTVADGNGVGGVVLWASVDLPPGASVEDVCIVAWDTDPSTDANGVSNRDVSFFFSAYEMGSTIVPTVPPNSNAFGIFGKLLSSAKTTGAPGAAVEICDAPAAGVTFPYTLRAAAVDTDGDTDVGRPHYEIIALFNTPFTDPNTLRVGFGGAYVKWRRVISTAPDPGFSDGAQIPAFAVQAVRALYASGITVGCQAPGDPLAYCPLTAVNRAQMATFLARAFGLYWPE